MPNPVIANISPDWLKPENASVFDSPITSGLRKAANWMGLTDPSAAIMGVAGGGELPEASNLPRRAPQGAVQALMSILGKTLEPADDTAARAGAEFVSGHRAPLASTFKLPSRSLESGLGKDAAMAQAPAITGLREVQQPFYDSFAKPNTPAIIPTIKSTDELSDVVPVGANRASREAPPILQQQNTSGSMGRSNLGSGRKLNPDSVRDIRDMVSKGLDLSDIKAKYPDAKEPTLRAVITGDSWSWVK